MSEDLEIHGSQWPLVEIGRIVLINDDHADGGKLASIVEIIDHKRVLIDGPHSDKSQAIQRQAIPLAKCRLHPELVVKDLPRGARRKTVERYWNKSEIESKWKNTSWYKMREQRHRRRSLSDFDRFKVMALRKQRQFEVRKALLKLKTKGSA